MPVLARFAGLPVLCALAAGCATGPRLPSAVDAPAMLSPCLGSGQAGTPGVVVGFGQGTTLAKARRQAYADISEQLSVRIASESEANVVKRNAQLDNTYRQTLTSYSEAQLSELSLECLDRHTTPGVVYLSYSYDKRARAIKIADRLAEALGYQPARIVWDGPAAIAQSPLLSRIDRELARRQGIGPVTLPIDLFWQSTERQWSLQLGDLPVSLNPPELQLAVGWQQLQRGDAALALVSLDGGQARHVTAETEYRLALKHPEGGYAQLLGIYENGAIDVARSNIRLEPGEVGIVPEAGGVFEAALLDGQGTTDTWLLIVTDAPMTAGSLPSLYRSSDAAQLQTLLEQLEKLDADIATVQLAIE